jgi:hypothetical protein
MQLPQWLARFNRHVTNRFWRLLAGWIPAHGILEYVAGAPASRTARR